MSKYVHQQEGGFKKVYIATGNKSKLEGFKQIFKWINPNIEVEQVPDYVEVEEDGKTLAENSLKKALVYKGKYNCPVIVNDSGMLFGDEIEEDLNLVKAKRNALGGRDERDVPQEEIGRLMYEYYKKIAQKYGGKIETGFQDVFTILYPDGEYKQKEVRRKYWLTDRECDNYDIYHPLNSLRKSQITNSYIDLFTEQEDKKDKELLILALKDLVGCGS